MGAQVSSTAGFRTQPNTPERRGFASPLQPHYDGAGPGPGDKALKDALAAAEAKLKASEASKADGQGLQEKVSSPDFSCMPRSSIFDPAINKASGNMAFYGIL